MYLQYIKEYLKIHLKTCSLFSSSQIFKRAEVIAKDYSSKIK